MVDKYDQLDKLKKLHDDGVLSAEEFQAEKTRILSSASVTGERKFWGMDERVFCMLIHLSQLLGVILPFIPFIGVIVPVVMWASEKDRSRAVDINGRNVLNWVVSYVLYFALSLLLMIILIGGVLLVAVIVVNIVFAIIGGVKANNGEYWKYPLAIPFFNVPDADSIESDSGEVPDDEVPREARTATASAQASYETAARTEADSARATDDPIAAESSNLNLAENRAAPRKSAENARKEKPEFPESDSAAAEPKTTKKRTGPDAEKPD